MRASTATSSLTSIPYRHKVSRGIGDDWGRGAGDDGGYSEICCDIGFVSNWRLFNGDKGRGIGYFYQSANIGFN